LYILSIDKYKCVVVQYRQLKEQIEHKEEETKMDNLKWHDGCLDCTSCRAFTKEEFIKMIEENFPDDNTFEDVVAITTITSNNGKIQSAIFGKVLKF